MKLYHVVAPRYGRHCINSLTFWAESERKARAMYAAHLGLSRCPNGTKSWQDADWSAN